MKTTERELAELEKLVEGLEAAFEPAFAAIGKSAKQIAVHRRELVALHALLLQRRENEELEAVHVRNIVEAALRLVHAVEDSSKVG